MKPHPDRCAATLAQRQALLAAAGSGPFAAPGAGSDDARVDLKQLAFRARLALAERGTEAARARLAGLDSADLWAGTVLDGTSRGMMVALEEAISLCEPAPPESAAAWAAWHAGADLGGHIEEGGGADEPGRQTFRGAELRRKRDILVASAGVRVRFSRKGGLLLVDRAREVHAEDFVLFEDRGDAGTLDAFAPVPGERPRLFRPGFLTPTYLEQGDERDVLLLEGRLGRRQSGFPCRLRLAARKDGATVQVTVAIQNCHRNHRLRIRFYGLPADYPLAHAGTPGWERVLYRGRWFLAATLVRACGTLQVGARTAAVPGAQCLGWIAHPFELG